MKIPLQDLREAFKTVDFVPVSPIQESSQYVRLKQNGNDLTLALAGALWAEACTTGQAAGGKWTAYIDRRLFRTFLGTAKGPDVELFYKDKLIMKSGQRLEQAAHAAISGYETWKPQSAFDLTDDQISLLRTAVKYLPLTAGTENVDSVYFGKDVILVTDTLSLMAVRGSKIINDFYMPPDVARFLASINGAAQVAVDGKGAGAALSNGFVYQPRSARIADYPLDKCRKWVSDGAKSPVLGRVSCAEFLESLRISSQFILDKTEAVTMTPVNGTVVMAVDALTGKFQRTTAVIGTNSIKDPVKLPARKILPWLEFASGHDKDLELEYAKLPAASAFRFTAGTLNHMLFVADL